MTDTLICPAGKRLHRKQMQRAKKRIIYGAHARDCEARPLKAQCIQHTQRLVGRHEYEAALQGMAEGN